MKTTPLRDTVEIDYRKAIKIDAYTGRWQAALRPAAPAVGTLVTAPGGADAREYDDFPRSLPAAGLETEYLRPGRARGSETYRVVVDAEKAREAARRLADEERALRAEYDV